jgi:hypothetical protein
MPQTSVAAPQGTTPDVPKVTLADYGKVGLLFGAFSALLVYLARLADPERPAPEPSLILGPVFGMALVVAIVWLIMLVRRNVAAIRGDAPPQYYLTYTGPAPEDAIERPARTFNNLMQLPTLFYVVCTLMLVTQHVDRAQVAYAWLFVVMRAVHATVYIGWNPLPYRFATWNMGVITLMVIWIRFAMRAWPGF